jgi:hypothetical protein
MLPRAKSSQLCAKVLARNEHGIARGKCQQTEAWRVESSGAELTFYSSEQ